MATNQFKQKCCCCGNDVLPKMGVLISVWDGVDDVTYKTSCKKCHIYRKQSAEPVTQGEVEFEQCTHPESFDLAYGYRMCVKCSEAFLPDNCAATVNKVTRPA